MHRCDNRIGAVFCVADIGLVYRGDFMAASRKNERAFELECVDPVYLSENAARIQIERLKQQLLKILDRDDG